jgi:hypothetical protein
MQGALWYEMVYDLLLNGIRGRRIVVLFQHGNDVVGCGSDSVPGLGEQSVRTPAHDGREHRERWKETRD